MECVPSTEAFSSRVEGTITKKRWRGVDLHPELVVGVAENGISLWLPHERSTVAVGSTSAAEKQPSHKSTSSESFSPARVPQFVVAVVDLKDVVSSRHERERERERERKREGEREKREGERERDCWLGEDVTSNSSPS